jgi:hypothetical protein
MDLEAFASELFICKTTLMNLSYTKNKIVENVNLIAKSVADQLWVNTS